MKDQDRKDFIKEVTPIISDIIKEYIETLSEQLDSIQYDHHTIKKCITANSNKTRELIISNSTGITNLDFRFEEIYVNDKVNSEQYAIEHYQKLGWHILMKLIDILNSEHYIKVPNALTDIVAHHQKGRPDLIAMSKTNHYKYLFVEVKNGFDGLRESQLKWIKNHPTIPVEVFHLTQSIKINHPKNHFL